MSTLLKDSAETEGSHNVKIGSGLAHVLADTYLIYLKTHNYHWNVKGPMFHTLHVMFEDQYTELATAIDEIAERIRAIEQPAPGSFSAFHDLSRIEEENGTPSAEEMIANLVADQKTVVQTCKEIFPMVQEAGDEPTADLLIRRMEVHEKTAWMLRSLLA